MLGRVTLCTALIVSIVSASRSFASGASFATAFADLSIFALVAVTVAVPVAEALTVKFSVNALPRFFASP